MPTHYSIIQYVPDPVANERINIGMIAVGASGMASRFLDSWSRVENFASGADISFLHELADELQTASTSQLGLPALQLLENLNARTLQRISDRWTNVLQLTAPAASLRDDPAALLDVLAPRFLKGVPVRNRPPSGRTRRHAVDAAFNAISIAVELRQIAAQVRRRESIGGRVENYIFDSVAASQPRLEAAEGSRSAGLIEPGEPVLAANGLSFETNDEEELRRTVDSWGLAVRDVKAQFPDLPIAIVTITKPGERSAVYDRAEHIFQGYAELISDTEAREWAMGAAEAFLARNKEATRGTRPEQTLAL